MRLTFSLLSIIVCVFVGITQADSPPVRIFDLRPLQGPLEKAVKKHYPNAVFEVTETAIHFESDARDFMIHEPLKSGRWQEAKNQRGPNPEGIVGDITIVPGEYIGALRLPSMINRYYFTVGVSAPYSKTLDAHLHVRIKYPAGTFEKFQDDVGKVLDGFELYVKETKP